MSSFLFFVLKENEHNTEFGIVMANQHGQNSQKKAVKN